MPLDHLHNADRQDLILYASRLEWILEEIVRCPTPQTEYVRKELKAVRRRLEEQTRLRRINR